MSGREDNSLNTITALDAFNAISDKSMVDVIKYDDVSLYMMCLALSLDFLEEKSLDT